MLNKTKKEIIRIFGKDCTINVYPICSYQGTEKGLYYLPQKAIYLTLKAALLFYKILIIYLLDFGSEKNQYDIYVVKKIVNEKQMSAVLHEG